MMQRYGRCTIRSSTLRGVEGVAVDVEVVVTKGMPGFNIVGMPDTSIQEARERIRAAIQACNYVMPGEKVVVNLAPGSIRKVGTGFDLPIAIGILVATQQILIPDVGRVLAVGELSLEGEVKPVQGILPHALCARDMNCRLLCPIGSDYAIPIENLDVQEVGSLHDLRDNTFSRPAYQKARRGPSGPDFKDIVGQHAAKRVLEIAAAGRHGLLMVGPPGSGKTMLASCLPSILPPLTQEEAFQSAVVYSVAGESDDRILDGRPPFRSPHHSASMAGLVGGGNPVRPGELSLAHNGVLFLDELAEFRPSVLQALRQPLESGTITIIRADGKIRLPCSFMLVAASNPCPCGHLGDPDIHCTCSSARIEAYRHRIGGPLLDRIDLRIEVPRLKPESLMVTSPGPDSATMRQQVIGAREFAEERRKRLRDKGWSAQGFGDIKEECELSPSAEQYFTRIAEKFSLSGRGMKRTLAVARTIADLSASAQVNGDHLAEALQYRIGGVWS